MRINVWVLSLMLSVAVVTSAHAQRGGGGGGRGGPGGGMFGGRGGIMNLISNAAVQRDLQLMPEVASKIDAVRQDYREEMQETMREAGSGARFQDMTQEEREKMFEKMQEIGKTLNAKYVPKVKDLMTADQFTRVQQINWQSMGTASYAEPEVVKALSLAQDQQDKIKAIRSQYDVKRRELFTPGAQNQGGREKMDELNKERDAKINELLTKDQLDKFAMLKGKEFDLALLRGDRRRGENGQGDNNGAGDAPKGKRPQAKPE